MQIADRIAALEERTRALEAHVGLAPTPPRRATVAREPRAAAPPPPPRPVAPRPTPRPVALPAPRPVAPPAPPRPVAPPAPPVAPPAPPRRKLRDFDDLEDALGGRVLAWVGGLAVALGVIFLLAIGVSRGWIGEVERTLLAGLVSGGLLVAGIRAHGRRGRTDAAKAAAAAGIVGLFATALVAGSVYDLVPALLAIAAAIAVGATATALAVRWAAPGIAALGILGALASPIVLDGMHSSSAVAMLFVATASATAVVIWQRWTWLGFATYAIATPQWLQYLGHIDADAIVLAVLVGFGALTAAAAVGFEVRSRAKAISVGSIFLLSLNALVLSLAGVMRLDHADLWLVFLTLAHVAVGLGGRRTTRISPDLAMAALVLGVMLADVAAARILDGLPLVLTWAAGGALFAGLTRRAVPGLDRHAALVGLGGHMALALTSAVLVAPAGSVAGQIGLIAVAATSLISGRLAEEGRTGLRMVLDAIALALVAYTTVIGLDDLQLTLALAGETFGLVMIARRHSKDPIAIGGAVAFAAFTTLHAVTVLAPPDAFNYGLDQPLAAAAGLGAAAVAVALLGLIDPVWQPLTRGAAALLVLYATAVELDGLALTLGLAVVTVAQIVVASRYRDDAIATGGAIALAALTALDAVTVLAPPDALIYGLADPLAAAAGLGASAVAAALLGVLDRRWAAPAALLVVYGASVELVSAFAGTPQLAQALLSALWAATGVGLLIAGLMRDTVVLRQAALALLAVTVAKVFLYDLASLDSLSRVASFIALGLLLLAGAFAWQRIRPRPLPDLRRMPGSLR
jgi:uncharacterized membrane protein